MDWKLRGVNTSKNYTVEAPCSLALSISSFLVMQQNNIKNFNLPLILQNDRMMADMAVELRKHNIATVSLWPGLVSTEAISDMKDGKFGERASKVVCAVFQDF